MIYSFQNGLIEIENPTIKVLQVVDEINHKEASVIVLISNDSFRYIHTFYGFKYLETWEDEDVIRWVNEKLKDYEKK